MQRLTKRTVDALSPTGVDHFIWDQQMPGFGVRVSPKGQKSFLIQYRYQGRTQRMRLGRQGRITADEARKKARILLGEAEAGKNPAVAASTKRKSPKLSEVSERFIREHVETRLKAGTQANYKAVLKNYIHDLRHTFASQAVMNGTPLALVSKLLGHSKITTTMRYAHLADSELLEASEGIGDLLKG